MPPPVPFAQATLPADPTKPNLPYTRLRDDQTRLVPLLCTSRALLPWLLLRDGLR